MHGQGRAINNNNGRSGQGHGQVNGDEGGFTEEERRIYSYLVNPAPITSMAETEAIVRETMRRIVYKRVFKLKEFISGDVRRTAEVLKASLGVAHKYKLVLQNGKMEEPGWSGSAERAQIVDSLNSALTFAVEYGKRLAVLKQMWEYFRSDYKVEMLQMISRIQNQSQEPNVSTCEKSVCWKILLPKMPGNAQDAFENDLGFVPCLYVSG